VLGHAITGVAGVYNRHPYADEKPTRYSGWRRSSRGGAYPLVGLSIVRPQPSEFDPKLRCSARRVEQE
jgi:hypothetical protein